MTQQRAISIVLVSENLVQSVAAVKIDEQKEHAPTRITPTKCSVEKKESDHNLILTQVKLQWNKDDKKKKGYILQSKEHQMSRTL